MARANPLEELVAGMTVSELAEKSGRSVSDIVGWAMASAERSAAARATGATAGSGGAVTRRGSSGRTKAVDTRTAAGRDAYEQAVLNVVREASEPVGATEIRDLVGGTPQQARAALNRLIEAGTIRYKGRARATRYFVS